jgi:hypothetical protein
VEDVSFKNYDTVLASGILYHLSFEAQMELFKKLSVVDNLIINTHFVIFDENNRPANERFKYLLSGKIEIEGAYCYSMYDEPPDYKNQPEAALSNAKSCWFDFDSLIKIIEDIAGFKDVTILKPLLCEDRCWLICKK